MKILMTFKDPDYFAETSDGEVLRWNDPVYEEARGKFMTYDEYLTIEYDSETQEARVVPRK